MARKKRHVAHRREIRFFVRCFYHPYYLKLKVVIPYTGFLNAYLDSDLKIPDEIARWNMI